MADASKAADAVDATGSLSVGALAVRLTCGDTKADDVPFVPVDLEREDDAEEVEVVVSMIL